MLSYPITHHPSLYAKPSSDLKHLFFSNVTRKVSASLLWIFSPLYIYKIFADHYSTAATLIIISIYFLLAFVIKVLVFIYAEDLSQKWGFKGLIRLSAVPFILFITSLMLIDKFNFAFITSAIFWGMEIGLYWWGYHGYFVKSGNRKHYGESIGEMGVLETSAQILTPLIGALVVTYLGFNYMFAFSFIFMLIALILLGRDHDKRPDIDIDFGQVMVLLKKHKLSSIAYGGSSGEASIYLIFWPIFLFLFFGGYLALGGIVTASSLIAALFAFFVGRFADKKGARRIVEIGTPLVTASWIIRYLAKTPAFFIVADSMSNFGGRMVWLPMDVVTYRKAHDGNASLALLFREISLGLGSITAIFLSGVLLVMGFGISHIFLLASLISIFPLLAAIKGKLDG